MIPLPVDAQRIRQDLFYALTCMKANRRQRRAFLISIPETNASRAIFSHDGRDLPGRAASYRFIVYEKLTRWANWNRLQKHVVGAQLVLLTGATSARRNSPAALARASVVHGSGSGGTVQRSGGSCRFGKDPAGIGDPVKSMPEPGTERVVVDCATYLEQQISACSRPSHLLGFVHASIDRKFVIANPTPASIFPGRLVDSTNRIVSSTKARLAFAVLTTERKAA
jgi:hypothetical protein